MKKTAKILIITLISFGASFLIDETYFKEIRKWFHGLINQWGISHIMAYLIVGLPIFVGILILHKKDKFFFSLGLDKSLFLKGIVYSLLCTLPMFIGYALLFDFNTAFSLNSFLVTVIAAALFEELYYRGFLFGQLYRYTNLGFIPSVLIGAILFGLMHLYQGTELNETIGIFIITFLGSILYAWVYVEWNYNLWIPIFLHLFMNLSWGLFSAAENALGGKYANIFRLITILLIIGLTIVYKLKNNLNFKINKRTLLKKTAFDKDHCCTTPSNSKNSKMSDPV